MKFGKNFVGNLLMMLIVCLVALILAVSHTHDGAALSMDSLYYLSTANHIIAGDGISQNTYSMSGLSLQPMTVWPPGFPIVVSLVIGIGNFLGISNEAAVAGFNVFALLVSTCLVYFAARLSVEPAPAGIAAFLFILSPSIQLIHVYAWSEVLFVPLSIAGYLCLQLAVNSRERRTRHLSVAAVVIFFWLATTARYVGLAFFAAAMLSLAVQHRRSIASLLRFVVLPGLAYVALLIPLFWRNLAASGALSGSDRGTPDAQITADVATLFSYVYLEFLNLPTFLGTGILLLSAIVMIWLKLRTQQVPADQTQNRQGLNSLVLLPLVFVMSYSAFLLVSRQTQTIDLDTRMLSVAVPFLMLAFLGIYEMLSRKHGRLIATLPFAMPLLAFGANAVQTHKSIIEGGREQGEPGRVLSMTYPSISSRRFDVLRGIVQTFPVSEGASIITDYRRPIVLQHLFGDATVRQLEPEATDENIKQIASFSSSQGLILISTQEWGSAITGSLDGKLGVFTVSGESGKAEWFVIKLPMEAR
jgi:hypothetical protein